MRAVLELLRMKVWSGCFLTRPAYADGAFLGEGLPLLALLDMAVMNRSGGNGRLRYHGFWNMAGVIGEFRSPGKTEISPDKGWKQEFKRVGKEPFGNSVPRFPCPAGED